METWIPSLPSVLQESTRYHGPWRSSSLGGTTESNNVSVEGLVVTTHKCVLDSCRHLQQEGYDVDCLAVRLVGLVDLDQLAAAMPFALTPARASSSTPTPPRPSARSPSTSRRRGLGSYHSGCCRPGICRHFRVRVEPQMSGGGQARGIPCGTVPTPLAVGMGTAC
ncbi:hypothetical protein B296_00006807 [Ensete ventricosum]|uniref:Uncharacterized protein n=1 Tax=Ensete ventricosum TaxID=4639 RepID=A0A427A550_ENSVE|nr:hypothetical protein B296_00006807 [Ensete ventricosum]